MAGWLAGWGWLAGGGRPAGWVVGKSDFNENPVVSLDLDLDFGLRLRVCQNNKWKPFIVQSLEDSKKKINRRR